MGRGELVAVVEVPDGGGDDDYLDAGLIDDESDDEDDPAGTRSDDDDAGPGFGADGAAPTTKWRLPTMMTTTTKVGMPWEDGAAEQQLVVATKKRGRGWARIQKKSRNGKQRRRVQHTLATRLRRAAARAKLLADTDTADDDEPVSVNEPPPVKRKKNNAEYCRDYRERQKAKQLQADRVAAAQEKENAARRVTRRRAAVEAPSLLSPIDPNAEAVSNTAPKLKEVTKRAYQKRVKKAADVIARNMRDIDPTRFVEDVVSHATIAPVVYDSKIFRTTKTAAAEKAIADGVAKTLETFRRRSKGRYR